MYCKFCGNQIDDGARFCSHCGKPQDEVRKIVRTTSFSYPKNDENEPIMNRKQCIALFAVLFLFSGILYLNHFLDKIVEHVKPEICLEWEEYCRKEYWDLSNLRLPNLDFHDTHEEQYVSGYNYEPYKNIFGKWVNYPQPIYKYRTVPAKMSVKGIEWRKYNVEKTDNHRLAFHGGKLLGNYYRSKDAYSCDLWIYDLSSLIEESRQREKDFYSNLVQKADRLKDHFKPIDFYNELKDDSLELKALISDTYFVNGTDSSKAFYYSTLIVFANERAYHFEYNNYKQDYIDSKDVMDWNIVGHRVLNCAKWFDFGGYSNWKKSYSEYQIKLAEYHSNIQTIKGIRFRSNAALFLIFALSMLFTLKKIQRKNRVAMVLCYVTALYSLVYSIYYWRFIFPNNIENVVVPKDFRIYTDWLWMYNVDFAMVNAAAALFVSLLFVVYLAGKSREKEEMYFLIPVRMYKPLRIDSVFKQRLMTVFFSVPVFILMPIPVFGWYALVYYIAPLTILLVVVALAFWVLDGREQ